MGGSDWSEGGIVNNHSARELGFSRPVRRRTGAYNKVMA